MTPDFLSISSLCCSHPPVQVVSSRSKSIFVPRHEGSIMCSQRHMHLSGGAGFLITVRSSIDINMLVYSGTIKTVLEYRNFRFLCPGLHLLHRWLASSKQWPLGWI